MPLPKTIRIKTDAIRRIDNPTNKNIYELVGPLYAQSVAKTDIPMDPNPRAQNSDAAAYEGMRNNLTADNDIFEYAANGMLMFASEGFYDNDKKELVLKFNGSKGDGLANGGHIYQAIQKADKLGMIPGNKKVFSRIIIGLDPESKVKVVEGASTSIAVSRYSILNLTGQFDWIKESLLNTPYEGNVQYFQNDSGCINVLDILSMIYAVIPNKDDEVAVDRFWPTHSYSNKTMIIKMFDNKVPSQNSVTKHDFLRYSNSIVDILKFRDYVQSTAFEIATEIFESKVSLKKYSKLFQVNRGTNHLFATDEPTHKLLNGLIMPIIAGSRAISNATDGKFKLKHSKLAWDHKAESIIGNFWSLAKNDETQIRGIVYNPMLWHSTYDAFKDYSLRNL